MSTVVSDLVPIRYGRMLVSPFTFYRGGALITAADLAGTPVSGVTVQLCGDAHLSNFGLFGTPERHRIATASHLGNEPAVVAGRSPAPIARAGPKGPMPVSHGCPLGRRA